MGALAREWDRRATADGYVLTRPGEAIRVRPRTPPRALGAIAADLDPTLELTSVARLVTDDGELGVIGRFCAPGIEAAIACVGGDPSCSIEGVGAGIDAVVEDLARRCGTGLGTGRARMFEYRPPTGWRGLRRESRSLWLHPDYPRDRATITVYDARPVTAPLAEKLHRQLMFRIDATDLVAVGQPETIEATGHLRGRVRAARGADFRGNRRSYQIGAFSDDRFFYQAVVETTPGDVASVETFTELLRSFRPLPIASLGDGFGHWAN